MSRIIRSVGIWVVLILIASSCGSGSEDTPSSTSILISAPETTEAEESTTTTTAVNTTSSSSSTSTTEPNATTTTSTIEVLGLDDCELPEEPYSLASSNLSSLEPSVEPIGIEELSEEIQAELRNLVGITEHVRRLDFIDSPQITVISAEELSERVRNELFEDTEDLPATEAILELLDLIPDDSDLLEIYLELYSGAVAGFYDGDTGEMVVTATDGEFMLLEKATIVHELTHALTDQHHDMNQKFDQLLEDNKDDEAAAYLGVIEGDAVLTEIRFLQELPRSARTRYQQESLCVDRSAYDITPRYLLESLQYPYTSGFEFVLNLFENEGGLPSIDLAYSVPPITTEQVLHPELYPAEEAVAIDLPDWEPPPEYSLEEETVMGELFFKLMLPEHISPMEISPVASGWGGDRYRLWLNEDKAVLVLSYVGDSEDDAMEMEEALSEYIEEGISESPEWAQVTRSGANLLFVATNDTDLVDPLSELTPTSST